MQTSHQPRTRRGAPTAKGQHPTALQSPAAARLIEQIQAEARATLLEELSAKDGVTVLQPLEPETKRIDVEGDDIRIRDGRGGYVRLYRRRFEPESWRDSPAMAGLWHPSHWDGSQILVDGAGIQWERGFGFMVCDDFGNLVEVA